MSGGDVEVRDKITPPRSAPTVFGLMEDYRPQIARVLPTGSGGVDRFMRILRTELQRDPKLHEADGHSFLGAVLTMASLGLEPGPALGQAWLLPFKDNRRRRTVATLIIGYRGYTLLAVRSGLVTAVDSEVVHQRDRFVFHKGSHQTIDHDWPLDGERGEVIASWAMAWMREGGERFEVLRKDDIERRRKRSPSGRRDDSPWATDYPQMARKSAVRALMTQLPLSVEIAAAMRADETVRTDLEMPLEAYAASEDDEAEADEPEADEPEAPEQAAAKEPAGEPGESAAAASPPKGKASASPRPSNEPETPTEGGT